MEHPTELKLIENRYSGQGRGYVYVSGAASLYPATAQGKPQMVLSNVEQFQDFLPS